MHSQVSHSQGQEPEMSTSRRSMGNDASPSSFSSSGSRLQQEEEEEETHLQTTEKTSTPTTHDHLDSSTTDQTPEPKSVVSDMEAQKQQHPPPRLSRIPYPIAHFLGYRTKETENHALFRPVEKLPRKLETLITAWIGALLGLSFVMITFSRWPQFSSSSNLSTTAWTAPIVIGSFGASSVILYGTPASPLGQPKNFFGGQFLSALVGVCVTKLFALNSHYDPKLIDGSDSLVWVAGGIATATALVIMILTDTVHPPGGATALLSATTPAVVQLGWHYLPVVLLSCVLMQIWALLWLNLGRTRYPTHWFTPSNHPVNLADLGVQIPNPRSFF